MNLFIFKCLLIVHLKCVDVTLSAVLAIPVISSSEKDVRRVRRTLSIEQRSARIEYALPRHNIDQLSDTNTTLKCLPLPQAYLFELYDMACIEEEIDSRLPYRIGYPKLPVLPAEIEMCRQNFNTYVPNFDGHCRETNDILAKYHIPLGGPFFAYRANYGINFTDRHLTLVLVSAYKYDCQDQWVKAVKDIRMNLVRPGIHLAVELIDEHVFYSYGSPRISPVLSTDRDLIQG